MSGSDLLDDSEYSDESVPANPHADRGYPVVVFGDHKFCAGKTTSVRRMPHPHMHSQVEINFVLKGNMTYWFDGRELSLTEGKLALFWGMIPHQVVACDADSKFIVLYVPMAAFLELPTLSQLRESIFRGAVVEALDVKPYDADMLLRWREDLLSSDDQLERIVQDELGARIRRLDREGWRDLRDVAPFAMGSSAHSQDHDRVVKAELMVRFVGEHCLENITASDVASVADLHPNYAMSLFKRAVGMTIKQFITRHRLDMAQSLLIATDLPIATVAFDCGFGSLSSFYSSFEQRFRSSPAAFRRAFDLHGGNAAAK